MTETQLEKVIKKIEKQIDNEDKATNIHTSDNNTHEIFETPEDSLFDEQNNISVND